MLEIFLNISVIKISLRQYQNFEIILKLFSLQIDDLLRNFYFIFSEVNVVLKILVDTQVSIAETFDSDFARFVSETMEKVNLHFKKKEITVSSRVK